MKLGMQSANAWPMTTDINKSKDPGPGFDTEKLSIFTIDANNNTLDVYANLIVTPKQD